MPSISPSPLIVNYLIYTTDTALALAWQAAHPSIAVLAGPDRLAASVGLTVNYAPTALPDPTGCWFYGASGGAPWSPNNAHFDHAVDSGIVDPNDLYTDFYNNWDPIEYIWSGTIMPYYVTAPVGSGAITQRRFACGFELGRAGSASPATFNSSCGPAGSRTTDGYGYTAMPSGGGDISFVTSNGGALAFSPYAWERFYFRPWVLPNQGEVAIWSCGDSLEGSTAAFLTMNTAGQLVFRNWGNAGSPGIVLGTSGALTLGTWVKIDLFLRFALPGSPPDPGLASVWINGVVAISGSQLAGTSGLGATTAKHTQSTIGPAQTPVISGPAPTSYKYDVDDWIGVAVNTYGILPSADALNGTHIRLLNPSGLAAAGGWTGDYRGLAGNPPGITPPNQMSASAPGTRLLLNTDYVNIPQLGLVSVGAFVWPSQWPGTPPLVGYRVNGGALIQNTGTQPGSGNNFCGQLFPLGSARADVATIDLALDKDAGGTTMGIAAFFGIAEYVGIWGPEDIPAGTTPDRPPAARTGLHNAPYPEIDAVTYPLETMAWASARTGTYVGNGTGQDVGVGVPFHWLWIRAVGAGGGTTEFWWSSFCGVHRGIGGLFGGGIDVGLPVVYPPSGAATSFRVSSSSSFANQAGIVYQWVAFSDPSSRFLINGAVAWPATTASAVNALQDPAFTPTCVFTAQEDIASGIQGFFYKGPGNPTDTANPLTGADVAGVMTFGAGTLTTKANAHWRNPQMAYGAWRAVDSTGASGLIDCVTYTGDGLSARNVAVNLNGMSPLFAFGIAHTLASYFRDPSHTGLDSSQVNGSIVTTAIIGGGLNYVTVGALLNVAGRVYDLFVIAGAGFAGSWTPNTSGGNPVTPPGIFPSPVSPLPPVLPDDGGGGTIPPPPPPHGWYVSDAGYRGDVTAIGDTRPANPRSWADIVGFAAGAAGMLGGSPGSGTIFRNRLIYAASGYVVGTDAPPVRIFDGRYDHELTRIPATAAGPARAILSLLSANGTVYVSTWDAGTDSATFTGRVFALDIDAATLTLVGDAFPAGHLPYALAFLNSALWCGSHRGNTAAGKVFTLRPDIDTTWTVDHDLATDTLGGVAALAALQGTLLVGTTAAAGTFAKVLARDSAGSYTTALTGSGGTAAALNGFLAFALFGDALFASFWNGDTPAVSTIYRSTDAGLTWSAVYTGAGTTLRSFIGLIVDAGTLYAIGGGLGHTIAIVASDDGSTWTDLTPQLPEHDIRTATPAFGVVVN